MDKMFAIEDGAVYVEKGGRWHQCVITRDAVELMGEAEVSPTTKYTLAEARAKTSGMTFEQPKEAPAVVTGGRGRR